MLTSEQALQVARTISQQIGQGFVAMTGAYNLVAHNEQNGGLSFRIPSKKDRPNYVKVELASNDTYTVTFGRLRGTNYTVLSEHPGIYADNLSKVIAAHTGLALTL